jgi:hypothetical protein
MELVKDYVQNLIIYFKLVQKKTWIICFVIEY